MNLFHMSILFWVPLLHLLLLKNTAATSSSSLASSSSSCEAVDNNDAGGLSRENIEAKVDQAVAGVTREVVSSSISNHQMQPA